MNKDDVLALEELVIWGRYRMSGFRCDVSSKEKFKTVKDATEAFNRELTSFRGSGRPPWQNGFQVKTRLIIVLLLAATSSPISSIISLSLSSGCFSSAYLGKAKKMHLSLLYTPKLNFSLFSRVSHTILTSLHSYFHTLIHLFKFCAMCPGYVRGLQIDWLSQDVRNRVIGEEAMAGFFICWRVKDCGVHSAGVGEPLEGMSLPLSCQCSWTLEVQKRSRVEAV